MPQNSKSGTTIMSIGALGLTLHSPEAQKTKRTERGDEVVNGLTSSAPVTVYRVDDFPNCPEDWKRSDAATNTAAFFMKIQLGHQVWFDLRPNEGHAHDVASVISCQRVNAVSGLPISLVSGMQQHNHDCPKHNVPFEGEEKYCPMCKHKLPPQNYVATTTVDPGHYWYDGFLDPETGKIREFMFTDDVARGVAAHVIREKRTNAFGVALYLSKKEKSRPSYSGYRRHDDVYASAGLESLSFGGQKKSIIGGNATRSRLSMPEAPSIEVGAGALVNQEVRRDEHRLDYWRRDPSAFFIIYYVGEYEFARIVGSNPVEDDGSGDGFLTDVPVGNG